MTPHLLYVDDEEDLRMLVQSHLAAEGYHIEVAPDGPAALAMIEATPFDVILLDLHMPGMGGAAVVAELRQRDLHPTIIILTGDSSEDAAIQCGLLGAAGVLRKPFSFTDLALAIGRAMNPTATGSTTPPTP